MASVTLQDVRKVYAGGVEAVKGVSLVMPDGSFTVLLGPRDAASPRCCA
jgi:sn-glycerol 3-phosphate transport system ATP-binding protein